MSHRLQVLIPEDLEKRLRKASQRRGVSMGEWVRSAIEESLERGGLDIEDPLARLEALGAPSASVSD